MGGEPQPEAFRAVEPRAGQREELREAAAQPRQIAPAADVGENADRRFRHRQHRPLGRDPVAAGQGDPDAAAHGDPVHEGDARLGVGIFEVVEPIFVEEEGARRGLMALDVLAEIPTTSPPAQKPRPSAWSMRMMRTSGSSRHSISALAMSRTIWRLRLCSALGRLRRRRPARPCFSVMTSLRRGHRVHQGIIA